jgi:carboxymethylenebutenolidase
MASKTIDIQASGGVCDAYVTHPDEGGPFPAVIFFMDGIGIRPVLKQMADRIAAEGYYVLLPNMFYRRGRAPIFDVATILNPENRPALMQLVSSLTPDRVIRDAGVFLDVLAAQKGVRSGSKVGLTGYCMGGGMVVRTAAQYPNRIAAGASFHGGRLATEDADSPHRLVGKIRCRLYFGHADQDQSMTPEQIERLDQALKAAGTVYEAELYAGALHGFTMTDLPVYNREACDKHWQRLLGMFKETLRGT